MRFIVYFAAVLILCFSINTFTLLGYYREKGLCYSCDSKYTKGHKCAEKKLFYIDCEEEENEQETSKEEDIR